MRRDEQTPSPQQAACALSRLAAGRDRHGVGIRQHCWRHRAGAVARLAVDDPHPVVPGLAGGGAVDWALLQQLRLSHPMAEQVAVDRVTVLRQGVVLQER